RGKSGGVGPCTYVLRTGGRRGETCGLPHTAQCCFGRLTDAWRAHFPDAVKLPHWGDLLKQNVAIFDLDFDAILAVMYAMTDSAEGDYYLGVPPDPGIEAAALGPPAGAGGAAGVGAVGAGAVATGGAAGAGAAGGTGAGGAAGVVARDHGAEGTGAVSAVSGGASRPRPYYVPLLQQPASPLPSPSPYSGPTRGLTEHREPESRLASPESRHASPESHPESPVRAVRNGRRVQRQRPPPVPGTHSMTLRPSTAPQRVPLPSPPASSLLDGPDPESDSLRATSLTVTRFFATLVIDPSFESTAAYALVAELVDFAAAFRLDYAASLVAQFESVSVCPPSIRGECALGTDVLEDRQEEFECFAAALPPWAPEGDPDAPDIPTLRSYAEAIEGTYVDEVPPPGANIVSGMWIFRVKRPPGSPPVFKARYVARGFSQREGVDFFHNFIPTLKMTTLRVLLHVAAQRDYELHSRDFSTAFLQGSLHEEIWLRRPPGFTGLFPAGTQWSLRRPVYSLHQAPREWHDTLRTTLAALGFAPSTAGPLLFLRTDTSLPPFYILVYVDVLVFATGDTEALAHVNSELQKRHTCTDLGELTSYLGLRITLDRAQCTITLTQSHMVQQVLQRFGFTYSLPQSTPLPTGHSLSAPPLDESVELSGPYPELVGCLMYLMTCTRPDLAYPLSILARYVAAGIHRKEHMDAAKRVLRYLCSTGRHRVTPLALAPALSLGGLPAHLLFSALVVRLRSTLGAMAAQELRWLTYLLTDLGVPPRSPPVLYVDNKAMIALCQEHRLEHRMKHIALRYFLARELQQRGQLRLSYVATWVNTADVFTKALQPCDHQRFCTVLGLTPSPQQLREWYAGRQGSGGAGPCAYVPRTGDRTGEQCGGLHATQRCFGRLTDAWRSQFPDATEIPRWGDLLKSGVAIFDLDFDAILAAMYAVSISAEGDCYLCVPPDPGIEAAALGASESAAPGARESAAPGARDSAAPGTRASPLSGTTSAQVLHTFTLDSGASCSFFRDRTTLTPLSRPVAVSLAEPSGGPILARYSTLLPCPTDLSGSLSVHSCESASDPLHVCSDGPPLGHVYPPTGVQSVQTDHRVSIG
ncbi:unnamed protein product, partial [Closterium sp. NIES-54]